MAGDSFGRSGWQNRWEQVRATAGEHVARMPPSALLVQLTADLEPGRALDTGCGHGAEAVWLAQQGWQVTAIDFSATALDFGRARARMAGPSVEGRIEWVEGDLGFRTPAAETFDLVVSLYVHVAGSMTEALVCLGGGVAPGGRLLLVGHQPRDPATGEATPAAGQRQVSLADVHEALKPEHWRIEHAEERRRPDPTSGVDAVIRAVRLP
jgi:SAM-dependent methyltransferase